MIELDDRPVRADLLTDREIAVLLSGLLGGLCRIATPEAVRKAFWWVAAQDGLWAALGNPEAREALERAAAQAAGRAQGGGG